MRRVATRRCYSQGQRAGAPPEPLEGKGRSHSANLSGLSRSLSWGARCAASRTEGSVILDVYVNVNVRLMAPPR